MDRVFNHGEIRYIVIRFGDNGQYLAVSGHGVITEKSRGNHGHGTGYGRGEKSRGSHGVLSNFDQYGHHCMDVRAGRARAAGDGRPRGLYMVSRCKNISFL